MVLAAAFFAVGFFAAVFLGAAVFLAAAVFAAGFLAAVFLAAAFWAGFFSSCSLYNAFEEIQNDLAAKLKSVNFADLAAKEMAMSGK